MFWQWGLKTKIKNWALWDENQIWACTDNIFGYQDIVIYFNVSGLRSEIKTSNLKKI